MTINTDHYVAEETYAALVLRLAGSLDPELPGSFFREARRQEVVEALIEARIWPAHVQADDDC
jgi:hypothetical protein